MKLNPQKIVVVCSLFLVAIISGVVFSVVLGPVRAESPNVAPQTVVTNKSAFNLMTPPTQIQDAVTLPAGEEWRSLNFYLKFEGLEGEVTPIEVMSWSFGATNAGQMSTGGGGGAGKASFSDLSFMKRIDKSTPLLFSALATGKHFPKVSLSMRKVVMNSDGSTSEEEIGYYSFFDVFVETLDNSGWQGSEGMEMVSLNFTKIEMSMKDQPQKFTWDIKQNKKF